MSSDVSYLRSNNSSLSTGLLNVATESVVPIGPLDGSLSGVSCLMGINAVGHSSQPTDICAAPRANICASPIGINAASSSSVESSSVKEALCHDHWRQAMSEEYDALMHSSLLIRHTSSHCCYILVYVDDILITRSFTTMISQLISTLHRQFSLKDLGWLSYFLGIEVSNPPQGGLFLSQSKYIMDLLVKARMAEAHAISTPMVSGPLLSARQGDKFVDVHQYRGIVGALQYATLTRPNISFSINKACQSMHSPTLVHWQLVKRILRYLKGIVDHGLLLSKPSQFSLHGYVDVDWASDPDDRKSTSGFCVFFGGNLVTWGPRNNLLFLVQVQRLNIVV
ncbi:uncharacterized protein LOC111020844 [Momordica charantia]|uniref:Uncharacterized protein LOC111020844 n=1 Tax=Momordica charantia TaxID=3673 RepID=A0A6J1DGH4_MOMCH|nr:uncharacterized protein LOC111020844 [Momordica charantia]